MDCRRVDVIDIVLLVFIRFDVVVILVFVTRLFSTIKMLSPLTQSAEFSENVKLILFVCLGHDFPLKLLRSDEVTKKNRNK